MMHNNSRCDSHQAFNGEDTHLWWQRICDRMVAAAVVSPTLALHPAWWVAETSD